MSHNKHQIQVIKSSFRIERVFPGPYERAIGGSERDFTKIPPEQGHPIAEHSHGPGDDHGIGICPGGYLLCLPLGSRSGGHCGDHRIADDHHLCHWDWSQCRNHCAGFPKDWGEASGGSQQWQLYRPYLPA
jgi:hypothetical protein